MENTTERPRAGDPPKLTEPLPILKELLEIERERLKVALEIEKKRSIVFPETTVIIRDIERLIEAVCDLEKIPRQDEQGDSMPLGIDDMLNKIGG